MFTNEYSLAESVTKTPPVEKIDDKAKSKCKEGKKKESIVGDVAAEQTKDVKADVADQLLTADQSDGPELTADSVEEPQPKAETLNE